MTDARPLLVIHARDDIDEGWHQAHIEAATKAYAAFEVLSFRGYSGPVGDYKDRDVVFWPWMGLPSVRARLRPFAAVVARTAKRVRLIAPPAADMRGPADLNGHDPIEWAKANVEDVAPAQDHEVADLDAEWFGKESDDSDSRPIVSDYTPSHPDIVEEAPPVPTDIFECPAIPALSRDFLPPALGDFIFDQSEIIGSDPCILAISVLVSCAAVTHDSIKIQPKEHEHGWRESARLWGTFVGDPSVKKTPPLNRATAHLRKLDMDFAEKGAEAMTHYKIARKVYEASEKRYIDAQAKNQPCAPLQDAPEKPLQRRIIVQDATIEALADILADNSGGVLVLFDELSGFFGSMDAYRAVSGKDRSFWLESYNGGPRRIDRVTREATPVPNLSTCILGGIQPHAMREQARKMVDDGLLQRFMIVVAQGGDSLGSDRRADPAGAQAYRSILDYLSMQTGDPERPVTLDSGAREVLRQVETQLNAFAKLDTLPVRMRYQLGKWSGLFCRLCLAYHAIACANMGEPVTGSVNAYTAERVRGFLFQFLFWHLQHFYEVVIGDTGGKGELVQRIADWILAKRIERFAESALNQAVKAWRSLRWEDRRSVLETLDVCGWIEKVRKSDAGGRTTWVVNPTVHDIFKERAEAERERRERLKAVFLNE